MRSYGKIDSSWDKTRFHSLLEDASNICKESDDSLSIGEDKDGNVCIASSSREHPLYIAACGVTPRKISDHWKNTFSTQEIKTMLKKEFSDNVAYQDYTIDEMVPRTYDYLVNGIIEYGSPGFLSEGRIQLSCAFADAQKMVKKFDKPFILGYGKNGIAVAPFSERSRFIDPLSCVVTKHGVWTISDIHSIKQGFYDADFQYAIAFHVKSYGRFESDYITCITKLECAFEDAVKMSKHHHKKESICVMLDAHKIIRVQPQNGSMNRAAVESIIIDPEKFLKNDVLLKDVISSAAKNAYEKFLSVENIKFQHDGFL